MLFRSDVWAHQRLMTFTPRFIVDPRARRRTIVPEEELNHINSARVASALEDRGILVNLGAHGQLAGLGAHWELWMMAQGGMTPLEVIRAGTLNSARYLGMDGDIGSIEPGKLADLVVLTRDPRSDIRNTDSVRYTIINGRVYDAADMNEIWPDERKRSKFFWE